MLISINIFIKKRIGRLDEEALEKISTNEKFKNRMVKEEKKRREAEKYYINPTLKI